MSEDTHSDKSVGISIFRNLEQRFGWGGGIALSVLFMSAVQGQSRMAIGLSLFVNVIKEIKSSIQNSNQGKIRRFFVLNYIS